MCSEDSLQFLRQSPVVGYGNGSLRVFVLPCGVGRGGALSPFPRYGHHPFVEFVDLEDHNLNVIIISVSGSKHCNGGLSRE